MAHQYKTLRKEASLLKGMAEFQRWGSLPLVRVAKTAPNAPQHILNQFATSESSLDVEQRMDVLELTDPLQILGSM